MKNRWGKEFVQRDLEATERRNVVIGEAQRRIEAERERERPSRFDIWADRALMIGVTYLDWAAVFLIGFLLGYVLSALR